MNMSENIAVPAPNQTAHKLTKKLRTEDVTIDENVTFSSLWLSPSVLEGLQKSGFERPSPIQLRAIPVGRCGLDLIVQAKSGTGKTCVFAVVALESILLNSAATQVVVLAPTREIALQIWDVVTSLGSAMLGMTCHTFIGGTDLRADKLKLKMCHIAIGTPGRMKQLIEEKFLRTESVRLFILDEADKLMESGFQEQINWIYSALPDNKQMLALSATYPEILAQHLTTYMRNPTFVRLNATDPALLGIRQYYQEVEYHPLPQLLFDYKVTALVELLTSVTFSQCLVFSNFQMRAKNLCSVLNSKGWPATYISGCQEQEERIEAMTKLKTLQCRVLVSTDLTSRGIDAENVNLVVNLDIPFEHETYLHRIGRAGRFGTYGAGVTLASRGKEMQELRNIERKCNTLIKPLPDPIPEDLAKSSGYVNIVNLVTTEKLITRDEEDNMVFSSSGTYDSVSNKALAKNDGKFQGTYAGSTARERRGSVPIHFENSEAPRKKVTVSLRESIDSEDEDGAVSPTVLTDSDDGMEIKIDSISFGNCNLSFCGRLPPQKPETLCKFCAEEEKKNIHIQYDPATLYSIGEKIKSLGWIHPSLVNNNEVEFILLKNVLEGRQRKSSNNSKKAKHGDLDKSGEVVKQNARGRSRKRSSSSQTYSDTPHDTRGRNRKQSSSSQTTSDVPHNECMSPPVLPTNNQDEKHEVDVSLAIGSNLNAEAKSWAELCDTSTESIRINFSPDKNKMNSHETSNIQHPETSVITYDFATLYAIRDAVLASGVVHPALVGKEDLECIIEKGVQNKKIYCPTSDSPALMNHNLGDSVRSPDVDDVFHTTPLNATRSCPGDFNTAVDKSEILMGEGRGGRRRRRSQRKKDVTSYEDAVKDLDSFIKSEKMDGEMKVPTDIYENESHPPKEHSRNKSRKGFRNLKSHVAEILSSASSPEFGVRKDVADTVCEMITQNNQQNLLEKKHDIQCNSINDASLSPKHESKIDSVQLFFMKAKKEGIGMKNDEILSKRIDTALAYASPAPKEAAVILDHTAAASEKIPNAEANCPQLPLTVAHTPSPAADIHQKADSSPAHSEKTQSGTDLTPTCHGEKPLTNGTTPTNTDQIPQEAQICTKRHDKASMHSVETSSEPIPVKDGIEHTKEYDYEEALKYVQYIPGDSSASLSEGEDAVQSHDPKSPPAVVEQPLEVEFTEPAEPVSVELQSGEGVHEPQSSYPHGGWVPVNEEQMLDLPYSATDILSSVDATVMEFPAPSPGALEQSQTLSDYAKAQQEVHKWVVDGLQSDAIPLDDVPLEDSLLDDYDRSFLHFQHCDIGDFVPTANREKLDSGCVLEQCPDIDSRCVPDGVLEDGSSSLCESSAKSSQSRCREWQQSQAYKCKMSKKRKQTKNADQKEKAKSKVRDEPKRDSQKCIEGEGSSMSGSHYTSENEQCRSKRGIPGNIPSNFMCGNPNWFQSLQSPSPGFIPSLSNLEQAYYQNYVLHCQWAQYYYELFKNSRRQKAYTQRFDAQKHYIKNMANYWAQQNRKH